MQMATVELPRIITRKQEISFMHLPTRSAIPLATAFMLGFIPLAQAKTVKIWGTFGTENSATTTPVGHVSGTFNTVTDKVTYRITYSGLSGPVMAAHFHGPAAPGVEAQVMLPIPGPYKSGMKNTLTADAATAKALLAGQTYVNLHTKAYPMGEARAQVKVSS
jgi:CHRD domain